MMIHTAKTAEPASGGRGIERGRGILAATRGLWRNVLWFMLIVFTAALEATWLGVVRLQGVTPDLVLLLVVYSGIQWGPERAMLTGAIGGLFQDVWADAGLGHHMLALVIVGYATGTVSQRLVMWRPAVKAVLVFCAALAHGLVYTAVAYVRDPALDASYLLAVSVTPGAFYTALVTPLVFPVLERSRSLGDPARRAVA